MTTVCTTCSTAEILKYTGIFSQNMDISVRWNLHFKSKRLAKRGRMVVIQVVFIPRRLYRDRRVSHALLLWMDTSHISASHWKAPGATSRTAMKIIKPRIPRTWNILIFPQTRALLESNSIFFRKGFISSFVFLF